MVSVEGKRKSKEDTEIWLRYNIQGSKGKYEVGGMTHAVFDLYSILSLTFRVTLPFLFYDLSLLVHQWFPEFMF